MSGINVANVFQWPRRRRPVDSRAPFGKNLYPVWFISFIFQAFYRRSFYQQLRVFSLAQTPLAETIATLRDQAREAKQALLWYVLNDMYTKMGDGRAFARVLEGWCPASEVLLVSAGSGGNRLLAEAITRVLKRQKDMSEIKMTFIVVLLEPTVVFLGTYGLIVWMSTSFLDAILKLTRGIDTEQFTGLAHSLVVVGELGRGWHAFIPPAVLILISIVIGWSMSRWTGSSRRYFDGVPPWSIYRSIQGAGWMQSFAMLAESKVAFERIMLDTSELASPWLKERIVAARHLMVRPGMSVGEALASTGYDFPSKAVALNLKAFGARPSFPDALSEVAEEWFTTIVANMKTASMILGMVSLMLSTLGIMWVFQASNDLFNQVSIILRAKYGGG
jgi:type II secretory pathway component PulF